MSPVNVHDDSMSELSVEIQDQLCRSKASLRTLAALLECYSEHVTEGRGYIAQPELMGGLASLLSATADGIQQPLDAASTVEVFLRDLEHHQMQMPGAAIVAVVHHPERQRVPQ